MSTWHQRRPKPAKRKRTKLDRQPPVEHAQPARLFRVHPDPSRPYFKVEVRIAKNPKHMRAECVRFACTSESSTAYFDIAGLVRTYFSDVTRVGRQLHRSGVIARMFLNLHDLRKRPSEIVAHECAHAAMAWVRHCGEDLKTMPSEEVLCYAVGRLVKQVNTVCYAHNVWK